MEERKPPPARLPRVAAVLTPLWSLLPPGASSGRSATPTSCNVAAEPPRRRPLSIHPDRPRTSPPDCAPQSRCSHGSCPRSSSGDLAPLGLPLSAVLISHGVGSRVRPRSPARATAAVRWHRPAVPHIQESTYFPNCVSIAASSSVLSSTTRISPPSPAVRRGPEPPRSARTRGVSPVQSAIVPAS